MLAIVALAGCPGAHAEAVRIVTGTLGATSDFVFRGLSLTRGQPAAQASVDVEFPRGFYSGAFIASTDPNPGPSPDMELDVWAGRYWQLPGDLSADLRLSQYIYPDDPRRVNYNRTELTATVGFRNRLFAAAIYSPNTQAAGSSPGYQQGDVWALEISARQPLTATLSLAAGVGHYGLERVYLSGYYYWNATIIAALDPIELQLAYLGVDHTAERHFLRRSTGDRLALTALWRFSFSR
jgi:uncharacterized protein (TIGR02001 family)